MFKGIRDHYDIGDHTIWCWATSDEFKGIREYYDRIYIVRGMIWK